MRGHPKDVSTKHIGNLYVAQVMTRGRVKSKYINIKRNVFLDKKKMKKKIKIENQKGRIILYNNV